MKKRLINISKNRIFKMVLWLFVFAFTFILRAHNYEKVPTPAHLDEMLYAWSGINLIETGVPISWSTLDYPKTAEVFRGVMSYKGGEPSASVTLFKPWLDEPPLFSLLVGWFAHIYGANRNEFIPSSFIRMPVVVIGGIVSIFVFLIAAKIGGFWRGLLAMFFYGTVPIMVISSRTAMPESLIALLLLLMIYLLMLFWERPKFIFIAFIPLIVGIAGLSKPTGYFLILLAIFFTFWKLYKEKKLKLAIKYCLYLLLATIPFVGAYFWYGLHFDAAIFKTIYAIQSQRPVGFSSLAWYFITPGTDTSVFKDNWFIFSLLFSVYYIFVVKDDVKRFVIISFIFSVAVVMFTGGEADLLAWYRYPSYPLLAIIGAWGLEYLVTRADFFASFIAAGMLLGNRIHLVNAFRPNVTSSAYRAIFSLTMIPSLLNLIFNRHFLKYLSRLIIIGTILVGFWFNIKYIYNAYEIACQSRTCPMVPTTFLSKAYFPFFWRFLVLKD